MSVLGRLTGQCASKSPSFHRRPERTFPPPIPRPGAGSQADVGELVAVLSGQPYPEYLQTHIFGPLGLRDCHCGMSSAAYEAYAKAGRLAELRTFLKLKGYLRRRRNVR